MWHNFQFRSTCSRSRRNRLHEQAADPGCVGADGVAEDGHHHADRRQHRVEGRGDHRGRGRAADVGLTAHGHEEEGSLEQIADAEHEVGVDGDPDEADEEEAGPVDDGQEVHLHPDGGHQDVEQDRAHPGRPGALQLSQPGQGGTDTQCRRDDHQPEEGRGQGQALEDGPVLLEIGREEVGPEVGHRGDPEAHRQDGEEIRQGGNASVLGGVGLDLRAQRLDGRGVSARPGVDAFRDAGSVEEEGHPDVGHQDVDGDPGREDRVADLEDLLHGGLIGAAADPGARQGGHAPPDRVGTGAADDLGREDRDDQDGQGPADDHAHRAGEEQDQDLPTQAPDGRQIQAQGEQHQRGWQQVARGHEVELRLLAREHTRGREQAGEEVAEKEHRHEAVEALPARVRAAAGPEDQAQEQKQDAEDRGVVGDQRSAHAGLALALEGADGGEDLVHVGLGVIGAKLEADQVVPLRYHRIGRSRGQRIGFSFSTIPSVSPRRDREPT